VIIARRRYFDTSPTISAGGTGDKKEPLAVVGDQGLAVGKR